MQERDAHVLADKVRRQVQGTPGVMSVSSVRVNEAAQEGQGWAVRVSRPLRAGGDVTIIGSDRGGYRTLEQAGGARDLDVLLLRTFHPDSIAEEKVWPTDADLGSRVRAVAASMRSGQERLASIAEELETRMRELPWVVVSERRGSPVVLLAANADDAEQIVHDEQVAGRSPYRIQTRLAEVPRAKR